MAVSRPDTSSVHQVMCHLVCLGINPEFIVGYVDDAWPGGVVKGGIKSYKRENLFHLREKHRWEKHRRGAGTSLLGKARMLIWRGL